MTPDIKDLIISGATADEIKLQAIKEGMKTLRMSAMVKVVRVGIGSMALPEVSWAAAAMSAAA